MNQSVEVVLVSQEQRKEEAVEVSIPQSTAISLTFRDIHYSILPSSFAKTAKKCLPKILQSKKIQDSATTTEVLHGISGHIGAGKILAIMGQSGSGKVCFGKNKTQYFQSYTVSQFSQPLLKTTLMDILSGRNKMGKINGEILCGGVRQTKELMKNVSSYVMQDDVLLGNLTVFETLDFALRLRVNGLPKEQRKERVDSLISKLNLKKVSNRKVGTPLKRGISGGERRRLSIGLEMLTSPSILFIDEVTSGLDAKNAVRVMQAVKNLCNSGCTIICTIHQPRSDIFHSFDNLLLLHEGYLVYCGPTTSCISHFANLGLNCPSFLNPADFVMDLLEPEEETTEKETSTTPASQQERQLLGYSLKRITTSELANSFSTSAIGIEIDKQISEVFRVHKENNGSEEDANLITQQQREGNNVPQIKLFSILTERTWKTTIRDSNAMYLRSGAALGIALLVGAAFFQLEDTRQTIGNRINSLLFLMCVLSLFCLPAISKFIEDRLLFSRERASGVYGTMAYFLSSWVVETPVLLSIALLYGCTSYWMTGLMNEADHFFFFIFIILEVIFVGFSVAQLIAAATSSTGFAIAVFMVALVYSLLMGGFIIGKNDLPEGLQWTVKTSYFYYGFSALLTNEFEDRSYASVVYEDGFTDDKIVGLLGLFGFIAGLRILTYFCLRFLHREKR